METRLRFSVLLAIILCTVFTASANSMTKESLGVAPHENEYFKSAIIGCRDGSKKFSSERMNDDFCDCPDGTDEPGTSACPDGRFYCRNAGHIPLRLFSSRVNDGICDCCDGSDEYDGKVKCPNTCWEAGRMARDILKKKIATYQDGVSVRRKEVEQAKKAVAEDKAELEKLRNKEKMLQVLVQELKDRKEQIEKAEELEKKEKDEKERMLNETEKQINEHEKGISLGTVQKEVGNAEDKALESVSQDSANKELLISEEDEDTGDEAYSDGHVKHEAENGNVINDGRTTQNVPGGEEPLIHVEEEKLHTSNTDELSKEELGRLVASRWTGENGIRKEINPHNSKQEDDYEGYSSDTDGRQNYDITEASNMDDQDEDEDEDEDEDSLMSYKSETEDATDVPDIETSSKPSWLIKIQQTLRNLWQATNLFKTPVNTSEAAHVRKEYHESTLKLSRIQSQISSLATKLDEDHGPEKEFYLLHDSCFEIKQNKYVYKVCLFKEATQVEGHSTTSLGRWDKFEDSYRVMQFLHGDRCWNGPDRSMKVKLRCGLRNELMDVDEPSRCEYVAVLSTPLACLDDKLKEMEREMEMNKNEHVMHEEL